MTAPNLPGTKPASELKLGDHVWAASLHPDLGGVAEVMFVHPYAEYSTDGVTVVLWYGGTTQVQSVHVLLDRRVRMASAEEIAEARTSAARSQLVNDLSRFADVIRDSALPLGEGHMMINHPLGSVADLAEVAATLGIEVKIGHDRYRSVSWPTGHQPYDQGLHVVWSAYADEEPTPEPEPALASGRELSAADEATPTGAREPLHTGGVVDGGQLVDETDEVLPAEVNAAHIKALIEDNDRATAAVLADMREGEQGRTANPNLARFLAEREDKRRGARHFLGLEESAKHHPVTEASA